MNVENTWGKWQLNEKTQRSFRKWKIKKILDFKSVDDFVELIVV